jgi:hypothetical protein
MLGTWWLGVKAAILALIMAVFAFPADGLWESLLAVL